MTVPVVVMVQVAIGLVLLFSSIGKLRQPARFASGVVDYQILPTRLAYALGFCVIPTELSLALMHITGWHLSIAASAGIVLFTCFAIAVAINLHRGRILSCHCFSDPTEMLSVTVLARLLFLLLGEATLLLLAKSSTERLVYQQISTFAQLGQLIFWTVLLMVGAMWALGIPDLLVSVGFAFRNAQSRKEVVS